MMATAHDAAITQRLHALRPPRSSWFAAGVAQVALSILAEFDRDSNHARLQSEVERLWAAAHDGSLSRARPRHVRWLPDCLDPDAATADHYSSRSMTVIDMALLVRTEAKAGMIAPHLRLATQALRRLLESFDHILGGGRVPARKTREVARPGSLQEREALRQLHALELLSCDCELNLMRFEAYRFGALVAMEIGPIARAMRSVRARRDTAPDPLARLLHVRVLQSETD